MVRVLAFLGFTLSSSSSALAAGDAGSDTRDVIWTFFNLFILLGVLVLLSRKPVLAFLATRREKVVQNLESSEKLLRESQVRLSELEEKTSNLDEELAAIRHEARDRAEREAQAIVEEAHEIAGRIAKDAGAAVDRESLRAQQALRNEAAELAIALAEERIKNEISEEDQTRLINEFVQRVRNGTATE